MPPLATASALVAVMLTLEAEAEPEEELPPPLQDTVSKTILKDIKAKNIFFMASSPKC
jgi:hypothetical protein